MKQEDVDKMIKKIVFKEEVETDWLVRGLQEAGARVTMRYVPKTEAACYREYSMHLNLRGVPTVIIDDDGTGYGYATGMTACRRKYPIVKDVLDVLDDKGIEYEEVKEK